MNFIFSDQNSFTDSPNVRTPKVHEHSTHHFKQNEKENSELKKLIERIKIEGERELTCKEIEINELRRKIEGMASASNLAVNDLRSRERKKTIVVNYTELKNEANIKDLQIETISYKELKEKLNSFTGRTIDTIDEDFVLEINCDSILGQQIVGFLVKFSDDKVQEIRRLPPLKRIRIDNVGTMISDIRLIIKYCMSEKLQIMNFNVNGSLIDLSLFINRMCENVVKKVNNLYLYYMSFKEDEIIKMCNTIKLNDHFQDLRLYACKFDISLLAENFVENHSIWLISLSFNHLKAADADDFITLIGKLKMIKEICAHHNSFEDEGCNKITSYISENLIDQVDYVDLSNNQTKTNKYIKILEEKGFKGVIK